MDSINIKEDTLELEMLKGLLENWLRIPKTSLSIYSINALHIVK